LLPIAALLARWFLLRVLFADLAAYKLAVVGPRIGENAESLAVLVREHNAEIEPVVVFALAFDHGKHFVRLLLRLISVRHGDLLSN
jgi:hypothetical protein